MKEMLQRLYRSLSNNARLDVNEGDENMTATISLGDYFILLGLVKYLLKEEGKDKD